MSATDMILMSGLEKMYKSIQLISSVFLLSGCSIFITQNPTLEDISGDWVATAPMLYAKLVISKNKPNYMAVVKSEKKVEIYKLISFKTLENGFECEMVNIKKNKKNSPEKMKGVVIFDRVVLSPEHDETTKIWFIRASDFEKYQGIADAELKKHIDSN